jgi:hypothetical protein
MCQNSFEIDPSGLIFSSKAVSLLLLWDTVRSSTQILLDFTRQSTTLKKFDFENALAYFPRQQRRSRKRTVS